MSRLSWTPAARADRGRVSTGNLAQQHGAKGLERQTRLASLLPRRLAARLALSVAQNDLSICHGGSDEARALAGAARNIRQDHRKHGLDSGLSALETIQVHHHTLHPIAAVITRGFRAFNHATTVNSNRLASGILESWSPWIAMALGLSIAVNFMALVAYCGAPS